MSSLGISSSRSAGKSLADAPDDWFGLRGCRVWGFRVHGSNRNMPYPMKGNSLFIMLESLFQLKGVSLGFSKLKEPL